MNALTDDKKDKKRSRKEDANNFEEDDDISLAQLDFNEFSKNSDDDDDPSVLKLVSEIQAKTNIVTDYSI